MIVLTCLSKQWVARFPRYDHPIIGKHVVLLQQNHKMKGRCILPKMGCCIQNLECNMLTPQKSTSFNLQPKYHVFTGKGRWCKRKASKYKRNRKKSTTMYFLMKKKKRKYSPSQKPLAVVAHVNISKFLTCNIQTSVMGSCANTASIEYQMMLDSQVRPVQNLRLYNVAYSMSTI